MGGTYQDAVDLSDAGATHTGTTGWQLDTNGQQSWFKWAYVPRGIIHIHFAPNGVSNQVELYASIAGQPGLTSFGGPVTDPAAGVDVDMQLPVIANANFFLISIAQGDAAAPVSGSFDWVIPSGIGPAAATMSVAGGTLATITGESRQVSVMTIRGGTEIQAHPLYPPKLTIQGQSMVDMPGLYVPPQLPSLPPVDFQALPVFQGGAVRQLPEGAVTADNPISIAVSIKAAIQMAPPPLDYTEIEVLQRRVQPNVSITLPTPAVVDGKPMLPRYWGKCTPAVSGIQGPAHIHAIADPDPRWNPATSGWYDPVSVPATGVGDARWTVNNLPDPGTGMYWLGDPDSRDYTSGIAPAARQWAPDPSTPNAPAWRSRFPYKPSVWQHVHYGPGGRILTISRALRFNLQFVEHMWMDWGRAAPQPFTWVMVGIIMDWPSNSYTHWLLDSGRDYRAVGFPELSDSAVMYGDRGINEEVGYRNLMAVNVNQQIIGTAADTPGSSLRARFNMAAKPRMFFGVYNGAKSMVGNYSHDAGKLVSTGKLATGQAHRFYVMGRRHGHIGNGNASHLVVFEIRFWHHALTAAELDGQYSQLSSTWKFNQY